MLPYQNPLNTVEVRIQDLLPRMTLAEKLAQLQGMRELRQALETDEGVFDPSRASTLLQNGIGQIARPDENRDVLTPNKTPLQTVRFANAIQHWLKHHSRLGIPAIFHGEALHGHAARDATCFPQAIALASTFNPDLLTEAFAAIAQEVRHRGTHQVFAPVLDVARDARWGRVEETLGEDPYLVSALGVAIVRGLQGPEPNAIGPNNVMATLKHLVGHGEPAGGLNTSPANLGQRTLREIFLAPFEAVIQLAGARGVMASYNEVDGIPSHINAELLINILRQEWGFQGLLVSDYYGIKELISYHRLTQSPIHAASLALMAGVDMDLPDGESFALLAQRVDQQPALLNRIDEAVARVLREKFQLGLFDNPYVDEDSITHFVGNDRHRQLAQKAAEEAVVLLKNDAQLLPLKLDQITSIAVIGPHADETLLGGYSDVPKASVSIVQGLREYTEGKASIHFSRGTLITKEQWQPGEDSVQATSRSKERWNRDEVKLASAEDRRGLLQAAVATATACDVAIVAIGENEGVCREGWSPTHLGDSPHLDLLGEQQQLVEAIIATGTPTIVVLHNGRPLAVTGLSENAAALLEIWYLGQETGRALARILFGDVSPGGKLPISFPRSAGHIPAYYNHKPTAKRGYAFDSAAPLFSFGHGLSYTQFHFSDLTVDAGEAVPGDTVAIRFQLKNVGQTSGSEVAQLYIRSQETSVTRPVMELKGFAKATLLAGESCTVEFQLPVNALGFYNTNMQYAIEAGPVAIMIGSSSTNIHLNESIHIRRSALLAQEEKAFLSKAQVTLNPAAP